MTRDATEYIEVYDRWVKRKVKQLTTQGRCQALEFHMEDEDLMKMLSRLEREGVESSLFEEMARSEETEKVLHLFATCEERDAWVDERHVVTRGDLLGFRCAWPAEKRGKVTKKEVDRVVDRRRQ